MFVLVYMLPCEIIKAGNLLMEEYIFYEGENKKNILINISDDREFLKKEGFVFAVQCIRNNLLLNT